MRHPDELDKQEKLDRVNILHECKKNLRCTCVYIFKWMHPKEKTFAGKMSLEYNIIGAISFSCEFAFQGYY